MASSSSSCSRRGVAIPHYLPVSEQQEGIEGAVQLRHRCTLRVGATAALLATLVGTAGWLAKHRGISFRKPGGRLAESVAGLQDIACAEGLLPDGSGGCCPRGWTPNGLGGCSEPAAASAPLQPSQRLVPAALRSQAVLWEASPCGPGEVPDGQGGCVVPEGSAPGRQPPSSASAGQECTYPRVSDGFGNCVVPEGGWASPPHPTHPPHPNEPPQCAEGQVPDGMGGCITQVVDTPAVTDCEPGMVRDGTGQCVPAPNAAPLPAKTGKKDGCGAGLVSDGHGGCLSDDYCGLGLVPDGFGGCVKDCGPGSFRDGKGGCIGANVTLNCAEGLVQRRGQCVPPEKQHDMSFYMYRAQSDIDYVLENVNAASLAGVMYYLEKEVVKPTCPRHYGITRIMRMKVTVRPTEDLPHSFGQFFAFDTGRCTAPECQSFYEKYGYVVGCQRQQGTPYQPNPVWYSLPGICPLSDLQGKTPECIQHQQGGRCPSPDGTRSCTWTYELAGSISIAELEGIGDYQQFCWSGGNEYMHPFWDGRGDQAKSEERVKKAQQAFKDKFPDMPEDLPDPLCDWT